MALCELVLQESEQFHLRSKIPPTLSITTHENIVATPYFKVISWSEFCVAAFGRVANILLAWRTGEVTFAQPCARADTRNWCALNSGHILRRHFLVFQQAEGWQTAEIPGGWRILSTRLMSASRTRSRQSR